ncbi:hypothetical protein PF003_g15384 [Phytophthora fragariae]|nr:hypothetical protein PF003_g15384 [Phytophthora fragariae]
MKSGGTRGDDSTAALITPQLESIAERTVSFDESMNGSDAKDEEMNEDYDDYLEEKAPAPAVVTPETPEDAVMSTGRSGGTRSLSRSLASELDEDAPPVSRNLVDELDDVAGLEPAYEDFEDFENSTEDPKSPVTTAQVTEQTSGNRPPINGDTPAANKVLGRCYEVMKASEWGQIFEPKLIRQAVWADLSYELEHPVTSTTIEQVAKDTVLFFKALGLKTTLQPSPSTLESFLPSEAGAELWKWKKKLRTAFGTTGFNWGNQQLTRVTSAVVDPARIPLPQTPKKTDREDSSRQSNGGVFSKYAERSPYFQDSHMVTPQSTARVERTPRATENSRSIGGTKRSTGRVPFRRFQADDDSSDGDEEFTGDGGA